MELLWFWNLKRKSNLKLLLAFSGSFLLSLTVIHLLPEVYESHNTTIGIFIMLGILFQIILEFFSKGAKTRSCTRTWNHDAYSLAFIHQSLYSCTFRRASCESSQRTGIGNRRTSFAHCYYFDYFLFINSHLNKKAIFFFMLVFAIMTPLGTLLANYLQVLNEYYTEITAVVIGILFHISSTIIFESEGHKFNIAKVSMIILGIGLKCIFCNCHY